MDRLEAPSWPLVPASVAAAMSVVDGRGASACCAVIVAIFELPFDPLSFFSSSSFIVSFMWELFGWMGARGFALFEDADPALVASDGANEANKSDVFFVLRVTSFDGGSWFC